MSIITCSIAPGEYYQLDCDHHLVYSIGKKFKAVSPLDHVNVKYWDQKGLDKTYFISNFNSLDLNSLKSIPYTDIMWTAFHSMFITIDKQMPIKECPIRSDLD